MGGDAPLLTSISVIVMSVKAATNLILLPCLASGSHFREVVVPLFLRAFATSVAFCAVASWSGALAKTITEFPTGGNGRTGFFAYRRFGQPDREGEVVEPGFADHRDDLQNQFNDRGVSHVCVCDCHRQHQRYRDIDGVSSGNRSCSRRSRRQPSLRRVCRCRWNRARLDLR
jgi:hypothetical protein